MVQSRGREGSDARTADRWSTNCDRFFAPSRSWTLSDGLSERTRGSASKKDGAATLGSVREGRAEESAAAASASVRRFLPVARRIRERLNGTRGAREDARGDGLLGTSSCGPEARRASSSAALRALRARARSSSRSRSSTEGPSDDMWRDRAERERDATRRVEDESETGRDGRNVWQCPCSWSSSRTQRRCKRSCPRLRLGREAG